MLVDTAYEITMAQRREFRRKRTAKALDAVRDAIGELHARGFDARVVVCPQYIMDRLSHRSVFIVPHKRKQGEEVKDG